MTVIGQKATERLLKAILKQAVDPYRTNDFIVVVVDSLDDDELVRGSEVIWFKYGFYSGAIAMSARYASSALRSILRAVYPTRMNEHDAIGVWCKPHVGSLKSELENYLFPAIEQHLLLTPADQRKPTEMPFFYPYEARYCTFRWNGKHADDMFIDTPGKFEGCTLLMKNLWEQEGEDEIFYEPFEEGTVYRMFRIDDETQKKYQTTSRIIVLWEDDSGFLCESSWEDNQNQRGGLSAQVKYEAFKAEVEGEPEEEE